MAGMLYSLVALGFVLIFKASGVFNFAQGAMVLFAALAMARFSEWAPQWLGIESRVLANMVAFVLAGAVMWVVAWLIERLVLRHLVNQEGVTLLMATLGITYFLDGLGQTLFGSNIYPINVGMPKDPVFLFEGTFQGGVLVNLEDVYAACVAALLVMVLSLFFQKTSTGRALRALAVTAPQRQPAFAQLPAISEYLPGFEVVPWFGLFGARAAAPSQLAQMTSWVEQATRSDHYRQLLAQRGEFSVLPLAGEAFAQHIERPGKEAKAFIWTVDAPDTAQVTRAKAALARWTISAEENGALQQEIDVTAAWA